MRKRQLRACEQGLAALEFALLAPALLMLVFAVVLYSFYFAALMGVRHARSRALAPPLPAFLQRSVRRWRRIGHRR